MSHASDSEGVDTDVVIVGAGPCGLFQVFELGLLGLKAVLIDSLPTPGGQCIELYPDKPIYDIPAIVVCDAQELVQRLQQQIEPFAPEYLLDQQVVEVERQGPLVFRVRTSAGTELTCKAVVIAGGVGSFQPMPLRIDSVADYLDQTLFYRIKDPKSHHGKDLVVLGGGDSAFDWALELTEHAKSMTLIHRSDKFRAAPASVAKMRALIEAGKMRFIIGNVAQLIGVDDAPGTLTAIDIKLSDDKIERLELDHLLVFFGLSPKLGPIANWGLELAKNQIPTDTEHFETNQPGIYAVGDIATYPGKKKLILSGFHEAALAAFAIKARIEPDKKVHLQYTTTSPIMLERLGIKDKG
jgi:thioredoxin reductase (NADPH)